MKCDLKLLCYIYQCNLFVKGKKYFGVKRRPEKKKKKSKSSTNGKKNVLVVKLNPQKLKYVHKHK